MTTYTTDMQEGLVAETIKIKGDKGDDVRAFVGRPTTPGPHPGVLLIHHIPGWDEWYRQQTMRFARHGYIAISPNLYERDGHGIPEEVATKARAAGAQPDSQVVADCQGAIDWLRSRSDLNGNVGVIGSCSGGRHTMLVASLATGVTSAVNLWGGGVVMAPEELSEQQPVSPVDYTDRLNVPLLGLFGNDDARPSPEAVDQHEAALKAAGKDYEFHRYDGAGHGFMYDHAPLYRQAAAVDGWKKIWDFFGRTLS